MKTLETDRLILREWRQDDAQDMFAYAQNPNIGPRAGWPVHETIEKSREIIDSFIKDDEVWAIELKSTGKVIGSVGLHKGRLRTTPDTREIGYVLSEDFWNQGFMPEAVRQVLAYAFEELNVPLVGVNHYPFNTQSKRVIEKCGFTYEGTLRHAVLLFDDSILDLVLYSMTKDEWQQGQGLAPAPIVAG